MNKMQLILLFAWMLISACNSTPDTPEVPTVDYKIQFTPSTITFDATESSQNISVTANKNWTVTSSQSWCTLAISSGFAGESSLKVNVQINRLNTARTAVLTFKIAEKTSELLVMQNAGVGENYVPADYSLVWNEEFNEARQANGKPALPNTTRWSYETGASGWGNNELQNYIAAYSGTDTCAIITNGTLKIIAKKELPK